HAQRYIRLPNREVARASRKTGLSAQRVRVRSGPQVHPVTRRPVLFIQRLIYSDLDHVQVKPVRLALTPEFIIGQPTCGSDVPLLGKNRNSPLKSTHPDA